ncbi:hypothetical protein EHS25_004163 [Saitozyma podzolica]|uniref:Uncharacterized protein n=1 Tax=Saitozyma podzolica TaxID=1890683 RepID=A0A427YTA8_9TREE|nr:hypothetical protein EHS25_004163 [Saitozyma podzolica]
MLSSPLFNLLVTFTLAICTITAPAGPSNLVYAARAVQGGCSTSNLSVPLPNGQTTLSVPTGQQTIYATTGRGIQNYTCTDGAWVSVGALAKNTPNATSGVSAEFASATDHTVFSKMGSLNASDAITDVPWLELTAIAGQGTLAKTALRLDTVGGQPPASCATEGAQLSVQYAANYFLMA